MNKDETICEIHLKCLGFSRTESGVSWVWGTQTVELPRGGKEYQQILTYYESDKTIRGGVDNHNVRFSIVKKVSTPRQLEEIINFASFAMAAI